MVTAVERLLALRHAADAFDVDHSELATVQIAAVDERFRAQVGRIPVLRRCSEAHGIAQVARREDLVPLLFPEEVYKTYRSEWLTDGRVDRMLSWLQQVTAFDLHDLDVGHVTSVEELTARLASSGCRLSWSHGATSQPSIIASTRDDLTASADYTVRAFTWSTGVRPDGDRRLFDVGPYVKHARHEHTRAVMVDAFCTREDVDGYRLPPIDMDARVDVTLPYRGNDDGGPDFRARWASLQDAFDDAAMRIVDSGRHKLLLGGPFTALFAVADRIRANGHSRRDFHHDNAIITTGGIRDHTLQADYREFICDALNVPETMVYNHYSLHEINTSLPECRARRYHVPPWLVTLPLDESGTSLLSHEGEIEGRAAFFDVSTSGRWGGVVTGDLIGIDFGGCACGRRGPTIDQDVVRFANVLSGDRLARVEEFGRYVNP